ncbi:hypothetical protein [Caballeronia insecticola]|uniref:Uncharacterized protein n=1 Tax=Caballeronia insecticola TaxID=758793 RepID=R4WU05_9BURK|nr:hypothetical protein [Caballeronia insecticola]BAN22366.1 putative uncharacterized protein [Caballeronia insecticola]
MMDLSQAVLGRELKKVIDAWSEVQRILGISRPAAVNVVEQLFRQLELDLYLDCDEYKGLWFPLSKKENRDYMMTQLGCSDFASGKGENDPSGWDDWRLLPSDYETIIDHVRSIARRTPCEVRPTAQQQHQIINEPLGAEVQRLRSEVARLSERLVGKNREIDRLERTIVRNSVLASAQLEAMERKLEQKAEQRAVDINVNGVAAFPASPTAGVTVTLPHVTKGMKTVFDVMRAHWTEYRSDAPPKSANVAREIDERLGNAPQKDGQPSRNGQAFAALIRPDEIRAKDRRPKSP